MSATGSIDYAAAPQEHLLALKAMTPNTIAAFLADNLTTRWVVELMLEIEDGAKAYDTGLGTSPGMWQMLSELVAGEKLPESLNNAIYALCAGEARVVGYTPVPGAHSP